MSSTDKQHPVPATLDAFEKVFEAIKDLAMIGRISPVEDELLAGIAGQLHELHEQFGEREYLAAIARAGGNEEFDPEDKDLKRKLQTRLVMQAETNRGSALSELATQELFDNLNDEDAN
ncbi:hypothetical protein LCGC14_1422530 [marine sediment metagenome]|uniref:Uncharacterized protein n=1 Tax=marine sediment metagenome TaxID=412755 RepID=A0A0F9JRF7_9ZZZZ